MQQDSTYIVEAEVQIKGDTILYQIDKTDIKTLYEQAFGQMVDEQVAQNHLYLLFTYIPLSFIFILLITFVNLRWNKAYKRIKRAEKSAELTEETKNLMKRLDFQHYQIIDRIFVFGVIWLIAGLFDTYIISNNIHNVTWGAFLALIYTAQRVLNRLVAGSALKGINDTDLINGFNYYIKKVIVKSFMDKFKNMLRNKLEPEEEG